MSRNYEKLDCYRRAAELASDILKFVDQMRPFRVGEQIASSALSISSNIAEGSQHESKKMYLRYLSHSLASSAELESQLYVLSLHIADDRIPKYRTECRTLNKMIRGLMKAVNSWEEKVSE